MMNVSRFSDDIDAPTVSVVLVVRNGATYLADALQSVLSGTVVPDEIVVIDGHSTDTTTTIAATFPRVRVHTQQSTGIAGAYNEGIREANGDLIAFISYDDLWTTTKLELQLAHLRAHPEVWGCVGYIRHFLAEGSTVPAGFRPSLLDASVIGYVMESLIVRRDIFDRIGVMDDSFGPAGDTEWFGRARDAGCKIALIPDNVLMKRVHATNTSVTNPLQNDQLLKTLRASLLRKRTAEGRKQS